MFRCAPCGILSTDPKLCSAASSSMVTLLSSKFSFVRGDAVGILDARLVTIVQSHEVERKVTLFGLEEKRCVGRGEGGDDRRTVVVMYGQLCEDDVGLELTALHIVLGEAEYVMLGRQVESMILGIQNCGSTVAWQVLDVSLTGLEVSGTVFWMTNPS